MLGTSWPGIQLPTTQAVGNLALCTHEILEDAMQNQLAAAGQTVELLASNYASDPDGAVIPLDAHIRLANPRTSQVA